jgi:prepilin-type N-terminal cleavage/methylation domain-containing protein
VVIQKRIQQRGFSLVELLVVLAIIAILIAMLWPLIVRQKKRGMQVECIGRLRDVYNTCLNFAAHNGGALPQSNTRNPGTFEKNKAGEAYPGSHPIVEFMKEIRMTPKIWYCPTRTNTAWGSEELWAKWGQRPPGGVYGHFVGDEFGIGYFYVANPRIVPNHPDRLPTNAGKFFPNPARAKLLPRNVSEFIWNVPFVFDQCAVERTHTAIQARDVTEWYIFPHDGPTMPRVSNVLITDGRVESRKIDDMSLGYKYAHPIEVFW